MICGGSGCTASGSKALQETMEKELVAKGLQDEVKIVQTGCFGLCEAGPVVIVYPEGTFYSRVKEEDVDEIVSEHLLKGRIVKRLLHQDKDVVEGVDMALEEIPFYKHQTRVALRKGSLVVNSSQGGGSKDTWVLSR